MDMSNYLQGNRRVHAIQLSIRHSTIIVVMPTFSRIAPKDYTPERVLVAWINDLHKPKEGIDLV